MNKYGMKVATCAIVGTLSLSGYQNMTLEAKVQSSSSVPSAGIALVLDGGSTIQDLQFDVVQNIAYLESISGVQPNIMKAAGKITLTDTPVTVLNKTKIVDEFAEEFAESIEYNSEDNSEEAEDNSELSEDENLQLGVGFEVYSLEEDDNEKSDENEMTEEATDEAVEESTDEQDFSGLVIARVTNYVNVRSLPSEDSEIVGKLYDKSVGELIEEENGWYKITSGNCTGYVKAEYCVIGAEAEAIAKEVGTTYAIVNTTTLKVRESASTDSATLGLVPMGEELVVVEELDGWVKISIEEGDGYVSRDFISLRTDFVSAESKEEEEARLAKEAAERAEARAAAEAVKAESKARVEAAEAETAAKSEANQQIISAANSTAAASEGSEIGKSVIEYATQFVGNPYVYGGTSLTNGADCSGFVMSIYANFGVSLPHSSSALRSVGTNVGTSLADAQPGDIICYSGHCALYVGNGQIVHASSSKTGIIVSSASYRTILAIRRIF
jgi:cell wall-associated NlpC family hydrolase